MFIIKNTAGNVAEKISRLENQYNITLPLQYKKFLMQYNGGLTPRTKFTTNGVSSDVKGFYGFGDVELPMYTGLINQWLPEKLFPIARDNFGNYIVLALGSDNYGTICFCDHEKGMEILPIAEDFASFVQLCQSEKVSEMAKRSVEERKADLIAQGREKMITPELVEMWQNEIDKYTNAVQEEVIL